jgi:hypothetical protein
MKSAMRLPGTHLKLQADVEASEIKQDFLAIASPGIF